MEKFSIWRDKGTGIAPFLPHPSSTFRSDGDTSAQAICLRAGNILLAIVSVAIKLPLCLIYCILHSVIVLLPLPPAVKSLSTKVLLRIIGLFYWRVSYASGRSGVRSRRASSSKKTPNAGDVVVSNFVSPLDAMVYSTEFDCCFVIPTPTGAYQTYNTLQAFIAATRLPNITKLSGSSSVLSDIVSKAKSKDKVVVLFAEGTTTNGRGFLYSSAMKIKLDSTSTENTLIPSHIKYTPPDVSTPVPVSSVFIYLLKLMCNWKGWSVRVQFGTPVPQTAEGSIAQCIDSICTLGRIKKLGDELNAESKAEFVKAWTKSRC
ncbi:hypothetical protein BZA70DRAFT_81197 [Myxozyma melibiosi]|uniref:Phospholipid/glycerol acyltransferase domain-containing protein n=1 Tax=Myxozyma melibiosi TaxID=54550 RepID=A0ABR1EZQ4_9ASCO